MVIMLIVFCAVAGNAQTASPPAEVFGDIGAARYENWGSHGLRVSFGGGVGIRPFTERDGFLRRLGLQFDVLKMDIRGNTRSQNLIVYSGNAVVHFSRLRSAEPYIVFGGGAEHYERNNSLALDFAGGYKIFLNPHLTLRPEARMVLADYLIARFSIGLGYHW